MNACMGNYMAYTLNCSSHSPHLHGHEGDRQAQERDRREEMRERGLESLVAKSTISCFF